MKRVVDSTIMNSDIKTSLDLERFVNHQFINLKTFRRNGKGVKTPVWFVLDNNIIYVRTGKDSWKVKRLRNNPRVSIVPSDRVGQPVGDWVMAYGEVIKDEAIVQAAKDLFKRKYGLQMLFFDLMGRVRGDQLVTLAFEANGSQKTTN